jgi:virulence-associated protein VapD
MFDLDTKVCEQIFGKGYRRVYDDIGDFLKANGFSHPQGSGYISDSALSNFEIFMLSQKLVQQYPYLTKCIRDIRTADIIEVNSINHYFDYDGTPGKFADYAQGKNNVKDDLSKSSLLKKLEKKKEQANQIKQDKNADIDYKMTKRDTRMK